MMTTPPDPRKSVVLRLSTDQSSGANIIFPERRITLHGDTDSVIIGRASKSADKGFIASAGNAWFHSPVMSRLHAQLSAKMDDRKIEIKDLGSLHGTFLNGDQSITGDESVELRQGDVLRFGAPIWRGSEQFFPTTVKVDFQFPMADGGASTFQVPDESDEEDLDDSHSDDSVEMITGDAPHTMAQNISAQSAPRAETSVIDLTGVPTGCPPRLSFSASTPRSSQIHLHDVREPASFVERQDETADDVIYDLSTNYELGDSVADASLGDKTLLSDDMTDLESNGSPNMDTDHAWYGADEQDNNQDGEHDDLDILSEQTDDDSQIDYPDEESASQMDSFSEMSVSDDLDGISIDDDMQGDVNVAGRYAHRLDASNASDDGSLGLGSRNDFTSWEEPSHFPRAPDYPEITRLVDSLSSPPPPPNPTQTVPGANTVASINWLLNSDKPTPALNQEQMTPPDSSPATKRADVLGARTGKIEYFRAREDNKMALEAQKAECSRPTSVQDLCNEDETISNLGMPTPEPHPATSSPISPLVGNRFEAADFRPIPAGTSYEAHRARVIAELRSTCGRTNGKGADCNSKRKAEDISDTTNVEERWAGSVSKMPSPDPSIHEKNTYPEPPAEAVQELIKPTDHDSEHPTTGDSQNQERPVKRARMMRVAERLGYAALGGVTAGAMIVGTLIYTAPTFG
jgi:hypothetical protein